MGDKANRLYIPPELITAEVLSLLHQVDDEELTKEDLERMWRENGDEDALTLLACLNVRDQKREEIREKNYRLAKMDAIGCIVALLLGSVGMWFAFCFGAIFNLN